MELFFRFLMDTFGYLGAFLLGFLSSFSIFLPTPAFAIIFLESSTRNFDPFLIALLAGLGAAIGETTGYFAGLGGNILLKKYRQKLEEIRTYFQKYKPSVIIFLFAFLPLPFDFVGIFCGLTRYPFKNFFGPLLSGKLLKYLLIAFVGYFYGPDFISWTFRIV
ncbi:MAG: VTT domain-containing protein [archaeon]